MKWKALTLVAAVAGLASASVADACEWSLNKSMIATGRGMSLNIGLNLDPDDPMSLAPSVGLGIGLGDRVTLMPAIGFCHVGEEGTSEAINELMYGGAAAIKLFGSSDSKFSLNAQGAISITKYSDFDETERHIPIVAAANLQASDNIGIYFGGGIDMFKFEFTGGEVSDEDPVFFAGLRLMMGRASLNGGLNFQVGEDETSTAINVGIRLPLGGS